MYLPTLTAFVAYTREHAITLHLVGLSIFRSFRPVDKIFARDMAGVSFGGIVFCEFRHISRQVAPSATIGPELGTPTMILWSR